MWGGGLAGFGERFTIFFQKIKFVFVLESSLIICFVFLHLFCSIMYVNVNNGLSILVSFMVTFFLVNFIEVVRSFYLK